MTGRHSKHGKHGKHVHGGAHARRRVSLLLPLALIAFGIAVACAPLLADLAGQRAVRDEVSNVESAWSVADGAAAKKAWKQARAYNRALAGGHADASGLLPYERQLACAGTTCLCYIQVPSVGIELPVYRGTSERALSAGAGHLEGTGLPVGGKGSNCCISAHSGVAAGAMFDGLRDVREGDLVELHTLGRELAYRVVQVRIVDQKATDLLKPVKGRDLLTLVTCTSDPVPGMPRGGYGVNDRRLVVTCERCEAPEAGKAAREAPRSPANGRWWPAVLAGAVALGVLAAGCAVRILSRKGRHRKNNDYRGDGTRVESEECS